MSIFLFFVILFTGFTGCNHARQDQFPTNAVFFSKEKIQKLVQQALRDDNASLQAKMQDDFSKYLTEKQIISLIQETLKKNIALIIKKNLKEYLNKNQIKKIQSSQLDKKIHEKIQIMKEKCSVHSKMDDRLKKLKVGIEKNKEDTQILLIFLNVINKVYKLQLNYCNESGSSITKPDSYQKFINEKMTLNISYDGKNYIIDTWNEGKKEYTDNFNSLIQKMISNMISKLQDLGYKNPKNQYSTIKEEIKNLLEFFEVITSQEQITNLKKYWNNRMSKS